MPERRTVDKRVEPESAGETEMGKDKQKIYFKRNPFLKLA